MYPCPVCVHVLSMHACVYACTFAHVGIRMYVYLGHTLVHTYCTLDSPHIRANTHQGLLPVHTLHAYIHTVHISAVFRSFFKEGERGISSILYMHTYIQYISVLYLEVSSRRGRGEFQEIREGQTSVGQTWMQTLLSD